MRKQLLSPIFSLLTLFTAQSVHSACVSTEPIALIGGVQFLQPYGAFVSPSNIQPPFSPVFPGGTINDVAMNNAGFGLIGGDDFGIPYAAIVQPTGTFTPLALPFFASDVTSVALNADGYGLLGDAASDLAITNSSGIIYTTTIAPATLSPTRALAINNANVGLIGGTSGASAYAAFVNIPTRQIFPLNALPATGNINDVALNNGNVGLIGGSDMGAGYAAFVNIAGIVNPIPLPAINPITSVAINDYLIGIIADDNYAAIVSPSALPVQLPFSMTSVIQDIALNNQGTGLISWTDSGAAFVAFVDTASGTIGPALQPPASVSIPHVELGDLGVGMIKSDDSLGSESILYVFQTGAMISIPTLPFGSDLNAIALVPALPTAFLSGNILHFANYINANASILASYFAPSLFDCTYKQALENAAPMRNALSLFTAENNLLFLNHGLSLHLRNQRHFHNRLLCPANSNKDRSRTFWFELIGNLSSQDAQHQTVGFTPLMGGAISGMDKQLPFGLLVGGGLGYTFTHILEDESSGHSHMNQEYLFLYTSWSDFGLYADGAFFTSLFQIEQTRDIHLSGFHFSSQSNPFGVQACPHFELGYDKEKPSNPDASAELTINPFIMFDWAGVWQQKYEETGNSPFNIEQKANHASLVRMEAGFRFYETISYASWRLIAEEKGSYVNKTPYGIGTIDANIVGFPGSFTVETLSDPQHLAAVEIALIFEPLCNDRPYGSISYQGEFGSGFESHLLTFEFSMDF